MSSRWWLYVKIRKAWTWNILGTLFRECDAPCTSKITLKYLKKRGVKGLKPVQNAKFFALSNAPYFSGDHQRSCPQLSLYNSYIMVNLSSSSLYIKYLPLSAKELRINQYLPILNKHQIDPLFSIKNIKPRVHMYLIFKQICSNVMHKLCMKKYH